MVAAEPTRLGRNSTEDAEPRLRKRVLARRLTCPPFVPDWRDPTLVHARPHEKSRGNASSRTTELIYRDCGSVYCASDWLGRDHHAHRRATDAPARPKSDARVRRAISRNPGPWSNSASSIAAGGSTIQSSRFDAAIAHRTRGHDANFEGWLSSTSGCFDSRALTAGPETPCVRHGAFADARHGEAVDETYD